MVGSHQCCCTILGNRHRQGQGPSDLDRSYSVVAVVMVVEEMEGPRSDDVHIVQIIAAGLA